MILPTKQISISNSLINIGAVLLESLNHPQSVSTLWERTKSLTEVKSFDRFTLGLDLLYSLGLIDFESGLLRRKKNAL